jgi:hypothetical protein
MLSQPMTRYEFVVWMYRATKGEGFNLRTGDWDKQTMTRNLEHRDAFMALCREFATTLFILGIHIETQPPLLPIGTQKEATTR